MDKTLPNRDVGTSVGMPAQTRKAMTEGRALHTAAMKRLTPEKKLAYKLCQSAISTIEMVQRKLLNGQPVMPEFLQSIGTLQSYGAGML